MRGLVLILLVTTAHLSLSEVPQRSTSLASLVEAELTFAHTCKQKGIRASFIEFFADDGIAFNPEPFRYKDAVKNLPPPENPMAFLLEWEPDVAGAAASGELGYTTGPSVRSDNVVKDNPKRYGQFFSIWKKQKDGAWKVAVDIGGQTPAQTAPLGTPFKESPRATPIPQTTKRSHDEQRAEMMILERKFSESSASEGVVKAYLIRIESDSRLHRENTMPIVGKDAILSYLKKQSAVVTWVPTGSDVSLSDDLGYTYGSYQCKNEEKGYYLHVWRRDEKREWRLIADITNPQPGEKEN